MGIIKKLNIENNLKGKNKDDSWVRSVLSLKR